MIAELGAFSLIIACILAWASASMLLLIPFKRAEHIAQVTTQTIILQCMFSILAFIILVYSFIISDFSIALVAKHSHTLKPLLYKITGTWGNHEGSMMLWVLELSIITTLFALTSNIPPLDKTIILSIQSLLIGIFLLFLIYTSNPFTRVFGIQDGLGLNPLLQDIGLAIHPPILYLGYTSCSIPFSLAILALLKADLKIYIAYIMRPWITLAWLSLGAGIGLGSWWAYRELGWGGFWFWDPVENASLMPWLTSTALLHSIIVSIKQNALKNWSIFLAIITLTLSILGTFLVRSGILLSVHSFASDPTRGIFILIILAFITIGSLLIFAVKSHRIFSVPVILNSKSGYILFATLFLVYGCFVVLWGTLYPIFYSLFTDQQISVAEHYFGITFIPLIPIILFLASLAPYLKWVKHSITKITLYKFIFSLFSSILTITILYYYFKIYTIISMLLLFSSTILIVNMCMLFLTRIKLFEVSVSNTIYNIVLLPQSFLAMIIGHIAFAIMVIAITLNANLRIDTEQALTVGEKIQFAHYNSTLKKIDYGSDNNYFYKRAKLYISDKLGNEITTLYPEIRFYPVEQTKTTESAIYMHGHSDLYAILGDSNHNELKIPIRIYYQPMINWLWGSIILITISGIVAIIGQIAKIKFIKYNN
ncbi:Cytochrome c-type biogenesis protein CcmF [Rickettsiales bacterium Ac37b]|nr:Cytochrome c-type biogenesis protein CcmF [Rickettsiales bacterium Ac37b]